MFLRSLFGEGPGHKRAVGSWMGLLFMLLLGTGAGVLFLWVWSYAFTLAR